MRLGEKVNLRNGSSYTLHVAKSAIITFKCSLPADESFIDISLINEVYLKIFLFRLLNDVLLNELLSFNRICRAMVGGSQNKLT